MSKLVTQKPQLRSLTGLRFFAAIYVVLFHHGGALCSFGTSICNSISYGYVSVSLFFVLSGFVLAYSYLDPENIQSLKKKRFWIARFARIYPLYLLSLILSIPSFASKFEYFSGSFIITLKGLFSAFLSILLLQSWTPWTSTVFNTPTWAVSNESFFYLIFPFIAIPIARLSRQKLILSIALLWVLALLPSIYLANFFEVLNFNQFFGGTNFPSFSSSRLWLPFFAYSPWFHLPQFSIGVCAGVLFLKKEERNYRSSFSAIVAITTIGYLSLLILSIFPRNSESHYLILNNGLLAPLFCILICYLANRKSWISDILSLPKILMLGELSYGIYLFQNPLLSFMQRFYINLLKIDISAPFFNLIFLCSYIFVLIVFSILATRTIENPMRKFIINKFNK
jgi:peptidoglycan/LPS O-acetylase OafA/YrhL